MEEHPIRVQCQRGVPLQARLQLPEVARGHARRRSGHAPSGLVAVAQQVEDARRPQLQRGQREYKPVTQLDAVH